jgi:flavodoxin
MKTLLVFYSRDGHTKTIAEATAAAIQADIEEITEPTPRAGLVGWLRAGKDASLKKITEINQTSKNPNDYEVIVIGTPIWAFTMVPAIRTWITQNAAALKSKKLVFFTTMGGNGDKRAFAQMQELCGNAPVITFTFIDKKIKKGEYKEELTAFLEDLRTKV